jgi:hypothetical protein
MGIFTIGLMATGDMDTGPALSATGTDGLLICG